MANLAFFAKSSNRPETAVVVTSRRSSSGILRPGALRPGADQANQGGPAGRALHPKRHTLPRRKANLRFNYFGEVAGEGFTAGFKQTWDAKWLTDRLLTAPLGSNLSFTVGGLNIFDEYPDKWDETNAFPFSQLGFVYGWETLPFGINGGYYFARLNYRFNH